MGLLLMWTGMTQSEEMEGFFLSHVICRGISSALIASPHRLSAPRFLFLCRRLDQVNPWSERNIRMKALFSLQLQARLGQRAACLKAALQQAVRSVVFVLSTVQADLTHCLPLSSSTVAGSLSRRSGEIRLPGPTPAFPCPS